MASEKLKLYSKIELELISNGNATFTLLTDLPGAGMVQRVQTNVGPSRWTGTFVRGTWTSRLPYNTQGHLVQAILAPASNVQITLYRARIWARELPRGDWEWFQLPVIDTPVEFGPVNLPIPPTSEEWRAANLVIPPTAEEWRPVNLPIPPTNEEWRAAELPIKPTAPVPDWLSLEVDK